MALPNESELIAKVILNKDSHAFSQLVAYYQQPLRQYCRRLCAPDISLADDIAQECFIQAYRKISLYSGSGKFQSWLFRIAYFEFLQQLRRAKPADEYEESPDNVDQHNISMNQRDLEQAMTMLSTDERTCLTLIYSFGYTQRECVDILDMPLGTIKSHCKRGKEKLSDILNTPVAHSQTTNVA